MKRRLFAGLSLVVFLLSFPALVLAVDLMSEGGFRWDIQDAPLHGGFGYGELSDGTSDAYDGCYYLTINGTRWMASGAGTLDLGGRQVTMPENAVGAFRARRIVYVPASGGDYARYLDIVSNPGAAAATVTIGIEGNLGSDGSTMVIASSSGDAAVSAADIWFSTDDFDGSGDPSLAHVVSGNSPRVAASTVETNADVGGFRSTDNIRWTFMTSIPAGGRVAILTFAIQETNQAAAQAEARRLVDAPDDALVGLDDYLDDIINFSISAAGAPRVRFDGPFEADEGTTVMVGATVTDPEGATPTWSWDLDDDGTFGEMPGATSVTVALADGPGGQRVGIQATDGMNTTERYRTISVLNVDPVIDSSPPSTTTGVGANWRYQLMVSDPGGDADPLTYEVASGPSRMTVSGTGLVQWIPDMLDVTPPGETLHVEVRVSDDDMGTSTQSWEMTVLPNRPPSQPMPIFPVGGIGLGQTQPRLVIANAMDPDRDPLTYRFQLDTSPMFDSPGLLESGPVAEMPAITEWRVPMPLGFGHWYWRVTAADETLEGEPEMADFYVVPTGPIDAGPGSDAGPVDLADAGPGTRRKKDGGGCSAAGAGGAGGAGAWALLLLAGALVYRGRSWRNRTR